MDVARETPNESAVDRAYQALRFGILEGAYPTGTMLGEASLAQQLGLSRTPVRAALTRLQDEGWIKVYPKRGALVQGPTDAEIADLSEARVILESSAASLASIEARSQLADRLVSSIQAQREAFAECDVRGFIELTIEFHRSFVEVGANSVLLELNDRLSDRQRFLLFSYGERMLDRCEAVIAEHELLVDCLRNGDAGAFSAALRAHLADTYSVAVRKISSSSLRGKT